MEMVVSAVAYSTNSMYVEQVDAQSPDKTTTKKIRKRTGSSVPGTVPSPLVRGEDNVHINVPLKDVVVAPLPDSTETV